VHRRWSCRFKADDFCEPRAVLHNQIAHMTLLRPARQGCGTPFNGGGLGCGNSAIDIRNGGKATSATISPVAGLVTAPLRPEVAASAFR